jgi:23S rRNA-/tRNA-specific pseudouridylate synthase
MAINIIKAGQGWVVLNKPPGVVVHATQDPNEHDLLNEFHEYLKSETEWATTQGWNGEVDPSVVHRLDRGVSGAILVVFDKRILAKVHAQFETKDIEKVYRAWVHGGPKEESGLWKFRLTKKAEGRTKPAGFPRFQVPAQTEYRVMERGEEFSKLELTLITGRKHQLRRHTALSKCPIVGDTRYGKDEEDLGRVMLHAYRLSFLDPWEGVERIEVFAEEPEGFGVELS